MSEPVWVPLGATAIQAPLVTALPASPVDGQEIILTDSLTAPTYTWHLRYVAAKATNKWVFLGGSPGRSEVVAGEATASTTYVALATPGPSFALPVAGDYRIHTGMRVSAGAVVNARMSYDIGGTPAVDADCVQGTLNTSYVLNLARQAKQTGLTAVTLTVKYRVDSAVSTTFVNRSLEVTPVAVGG